jgi:release factor glutamine methyltransferase
MDYQHWLRHAINRLSHSESPRRDAEILLGFVTGKARTFILAFGETALSDTELARLDDLLARREQGEPVAHLVGVRVLVVAAVCLACDVDSAPGYRMSG